MDKINERLYFKSSKINSLHESFHYLVENAVFFKWTFFKNRPRSSYLLTRALFINSLVFTIYYSIFSHIKFLIMGIDVDPILLFSGTTAIGYWAMSQSFHRKCNFLSNLYNDAIKADAKGDLREAQMLKLNFSMQLLTMDLWGHRLFSWVLSETLEEAVSWGYSTNKLTEGDYQSFCKELNHSQISTGQARNILLMRLKEISKSSKDEMNDTNQSKSHLKIA